MMHRLSLAVVIALFATACSTPRLLKAAEAGDLADVNRQLAAGEAVDVRGVEGVTPLAWAAAKGSRDIASTLVAHGASVNARSDAGYTPLHVAAYWGHRGVDGRWRQVAAMLLQHGANVDVRPQKSPSTLYLAAVIGDEPLMVALIDRGVALDEVTVGETALHAAIAERHAGVVALLLKRGASVNVVNMSQRTPLHFAASLLDDEAVVESLLARGANVNARDAQGHTPLWFANAAGHRRVVEALRAHGGT